MALNKTQRAVLKELVRKAEKGPSLGFGGAAGPSPDRPLLTREEAERGARAWAQSWLAEPARLLLENDAGKVSAGELKRWTR